MIFDISSKSLPARDRCRSARNWRFGNEPLPDTPASDVAATPTGSKKSPLSDPVSARQPLTLIITLTVDELGFPGQVRPTSGTPNAPAQSAPRFLSNRGALPSLGANHRFRLAKTQGTWNARQRKERPGRRPKNSNSSRLATPVLLSFLPRTRRWAMIATIAQ